jgi:hypothetical protein
MMKRITIAILLALIAVSGVSTAWMPSASAAESLDSVEAP